MELYHENPQKLHINTEENRSYYIPFPEKMPGMNAIDAAKSPRVLSLCGQWQFAYFDAYAAMPDEFSFNDTIPVPSVWQNHGYDKHQYTNIQYPFPCDPPHIPTENPCGVYQRDFTVDVEKGMRYYLNFEGVDSCFYLYINGKFVGYSQVSHSTSEFDVTDCLNSGENTVRVDVLKFCDGSYLEDQDKFRMSGIFRPVYLITRPEKHLRDYFIHQKLSADYGKAEVDIELFFAGGEQDVTCEVYAPDGALVCTAASKNGHIGFALDNPVLWNAENPKLYELILICGGEYIPQQMGVREITVDDGVLKVNGSPIKFRGVNRHDSDPVVGFAVGYEHLMRDLTVMRRHNVNAIRTSHYPNAPIMPLLCDKYGFYLIDESDMETHGVGDIYWPTGTERPDTMDMIANMELYELSVLDRQQRNVIRDKNCCSVIMWSLGNESGFGANYVKAAEWIKQYDPSRLVHYEGASAGEFKGTEGAFTLDVHSRMYPSVDDARAWLESGKDRRPYVLCEYVHAMGNGPGDIWDYQQLIDEFDQFCGGFVWEFCDHAIDMGKTVEGKRKYFYGGDFGEFPHSGNFCSDGLVAPDRTPHPGFLEFKNVVCPIRATLVNTEPLTVELKNCRDFADMSSFATGRYELTVDGETVACGEFEIPSAKPRETAQVVLPVEIPQSGKCLLNIYYLQKEATGLLEAGHTLGFDQLLLRDARVKPTVAKLPGSGEVGVAETKTHIEVFGGDFTYSFNKLTGSFDRMIAMGKLLLDEPITYNIWRAPTDNDRNIAHEWRRAGYDRVQTRVSGLTVEKQNGCVVIKCTLALAAVYRQRIMDIDAQYTVCRDGSIEVKLDARRSEMMPFLPRFGVRMLLPKEYTGVTYFGFGPNESYIDKRRSSMLGKFTTTPKDNHHDYVTPQENGSHYACDYVALNNGRGTALNVSSETPFCFNVSPYTQEELAAKAHSFELVESGWTVLCIDAAQSGVGSNSCGPRLRDEYRLSDEQINFTFTLQPSGM